MKAITKTGRVLFRSKPKKYPSRTWLFIIKFLDSGRREVQVVMSDEDEFVSPHTMASSLRQSCNKLERSFSFYIKVEERNGSVFLVRK